MPLQNRVTPFGDIIAISARGMFTGNRGIIHDPATKTLLNKRWTNKAWIVCTCVYKNVRRDVMARQSWTELFFLDEATAFAAGHRPCFDCRRGDAKAFAAAWGQALGEIPGAKLMDGVLDEQRRSGRAKRLHPLPSAIEHLPDGTMLAKGEEAFMVNAGKIYRWTPDGYQQTAKIVPNALLTPPAIVAALGAGYRPVLHPSLDQAG